MDTKLPAWIGLGGLALSVSAGSMNAFVLMDTLRTPVSHLTGTSTNFAIALARLDLPLALRLFLLLATFFVGSAVSGMIIRDYHVKLGRRYGVVLMFESVMIMFAILVYPNNPWVGQFAISFACGLQNAMATTFSRAVVRTTHVTGLITDLGIQLGHKIVGLKVDKPKTKLLSILVGGYILGSIIGALLYTHLHVYVLLIAAVITGGTGFPYYLVVMYKKKAPARNEQGL